MLRSPHAGGTDAHLPLTLTMVRRTIGPRRFFGTSVNWTPLSVRLVWRVMIDILRVGSGHWDRMISGVSASGHAGACGSGETDAETTARESQLAVTANLALAANQWRSTVARLGELDGYANQIVPAPLDEMVATFCVETVGCIGSLRRTRCLQPPRTRDHL
jgi:hypothetical protein